MVTDAAQPDSYSRTGSRGTVAILRRRGIASLLGLLIVASTTTVATPISPAAAAAAAADEHKQRVIVQLSHPSSLDQAVTEERQRGGRIRHTYRHVLTGFAADLAPERISALRKDPRVKAVSLDQRTQIAGVQPAPPWGLDRIDQREALLDDSYSYDSSGVGATVYVVDSGVRMDHADFEGRVRSGYDFVDGDANATDCNGHGTHVAGTVGGAKYGVAKQVEMVSLRVFDCGGSGWSTDTIAAFDWVVSHKQGPAVINFSGGGGAYAPMDEAAARTSAAGVPTVVAAGNDSDDACLTSPARAPAAITVGATAQGDYRAGFSNYGPCLDLFAPGASVLSSTMGSDTSSGYMSGTSMATPHVAGAVARYLQSHPTATAAETTAALQTVATPDVVADSLSGNDGLLYVPPPPAATPPGPPTGVSATVQDRTATVSWAPPASDGGSAGTGCGSLLPRT